MQTPFILTEQLSLAHELINDLRHVSVQQDRMRFRKNLERLGEILAYEISKTFDYRTCDIQTPLAIAHGHKTDRPPVLAAIMRAALPMYNGFINMIDHADSAFIAAYRGAADEDDYTFDISLEYTASPELQNRTLILIDPMLATGKSLVKSYKALCQYGKPAVVHIAAAIAAPEGVAYVQKHLPEAKLWLAALDKGLNSKFYIVPGLGDAGDLAFGAKLTEQ